MIRDEVHAFHRQCIFLIPLVRSGQLSQFELNYLAGSVETVRAELKVIGAQTSEVRVALIGHPDAGKSTLADGFGERCREGCCVDREPTFEGEIPL